MSFLFLTPAQAWTLLAGALLGVVAIYLLKPPPVPLHVASMRLWEKVLERRDDRKERWRYIVSLLLALMIAALLALSLAGLQPGDADEAQDTVLLIDNSASSATLTRGGQTRLERAKDIARALVSSSAGEILVADTAGQLGELRFASRGLAEQRIDRLETQDGDFLRVPSFDRADVTVHFITDGVSQLEAPEGAELHSIFEPAINVGITAFGTRESATERGRVQAALEVVNGSLQPALTKLEIQADDELLVERPLRLEAGESWSAAINLTGHAGKRIRARVSTPGDALDRDDRAAIVAGESRQQTRVALLGEESRAALELLLRSAPTLLLTTPEQAEVNLVLEGAASADVDRPTLFLGPRQIEETATVRRESPDGLRVRTPHPSLAGVPWQTLRPTLRTLRDLPEADEVAEGQPVPILTSDAGPALLALGPDSLALTLALEPSLLGHTFFPEFLEAAVTHLASPGPLGRRTTAGAGDRSPFVNRSALAPLAEGGLAEELEPAEAAPSAPRLWRALLVGALFLLTLQGITAARRLTV